MESRKVLILNCAHPPKRRDFAGFKGAIPGYRGSGPAPKLCSAPRQTSRRPGNSRPPFFIPRLRSPSRKFFRTPIYCGYSSLCRSTEISPSCPHSASKPSLSRRGLRRWRYGRSRTSAHGRRSIRGPVPGSVYRAFFRPTLKFCVSGNPRFPHPSSISFFNSERRSA